jgi:hypothetical protein
MSSTRWSTKEENTQSEENTNEEDIQQLDQDRLDNLLLNLRTISGIKDFDKLSINNENLNIDQTWIQSISRWYYAEGRDITLMKINDILEETFEYIEVIKNNIYDNANRDIQRILIGLTTASKGLECLKFTYKKDINIITKLNLYSEKINMKITELNISINIIPVMSG